MLFTESTMFQHYTLQAGKAAYRRIKENGLTPDDVHVVAGAAGGPKWLILAGMDRLLFSQWFFGRTSPLFLIGSSSGAWRFAAAAQQDPLDAICRLETAYINQRYDANPSPAQISREGEKILAHMMGTRGDTDVLRHPSFRLNFMSVRGKHLTGVDHKINLLVGMALAALGNAIRRRWLGFFFERILFHDTRDTPPFHGMDAFPIHRVGLSRANVRPALMSSGSIPLVMKGIRNIPGAPKGTYRDGGVIDYHLDIPFSNDYDHIVLFPHYMERIIPGWLDKKLSWRKPAMSHLKNVLFIAPSSALLEKLPLRKIPDRTDFSRFRGHDDERIAYWNRTVQLSRQLAEEFIEAVESGRIRNQVEPLVI